MIHIKDETNVFILGVDLPVGIYGQELVASKDNKNLYTIGNAYGSNDKSIFKFACTNSITDCSWTKIETKLQYGRYNTVAIPLRDSMANKLCKGIVLTTESYRQAWNAKGLNQNVFSERPIHVIFPLS